MKQVPQHFVPVAIDLLDWYLDKVQTFFLALNRHGMLSSKLIAVIGDTCKVSIPQSCQNPSHPECKFASAQLCHGQVIFVQSATINLQLTC